MIGCCEVPVQEAGGQQPQVGRSCFGGGARGAPKRSNGRVRGLRRRWKALCCVSGLVVGTLEFRCGVYLGKKARMKIPRNIVVFRRLVSKGI